MYHTSAPDTRQQTRLNTKNTTHANVLRFIHNKFNFRANFDSWKFYGIFIKKVSHLKEEEKKCYLGFSRRSLFAFAFFSSRTYFNARSHPYRHPARAGPLKWLQA